MQLELVLKCCMHVLMILISVYLVKECVELEEWFSCEFVGKLLWREGICVKLMRKELLQKDHMMSVKKCKEKASMIAAVAERSRWPRIWDSALECGGRYTKSVQALTRLMSHHGRERSCAPTVTAVKSLLQNVINAHYRLLQIPEHSTSETILHAICNDIFFRYCSL